MKFIEPPSCGSLSAIVFIGRDSRGNWIAQEQNGLFGEIELDMHQRVSAAPASAAPERPTTCPEGAMT